MKQNLCMAVVLWGLIGVVPALAADTAKDEAKKEEKVITATEDKTPLTEWIEAENKLIDTLSADNKKAFYVMRNKHGILRSIRVVDRDVGKAVKACAKANAGLKQEITERYKDWQNAVLPILDTAEKFLNEEVDTQTVVVPSDFKYVLKMNDKAFEYGEKQIRKEPVTTEEACRGLIDSMDRTENDLIELLQDALLPEEVIRQRLERLEKEKEKEKEQEQAKEAATPE